MKTTYVQLANGYYVTHATTNANLNVTKIGITPDIREAHEHFDYVARAIATHVWFTRKMRCTFVEVR
jgi:hypothetical protein